MITFEIALKISIRTRVARVTELAMNRDAKSGSSSRASLEASTLKSEEEAAESMRPSRKGDPCPFLMLTNTSRTRGLGSASGHALSTSSWSLTRKKSFRSFGSRGGVDVTSPVTVNRSSRFLLNYSCRFQTFGRR